MTGPTPEHADFDELAAGYALHALDPADEQRFLAHLAGCPRCRAALEDFTEVTAGLADTGLADMGLADTGLADTALADTALADNVAGAEPSPQLGQRIMAAIAQDAEAGRRQAGEQAGASHSAESRGADSEPPPAGVADLSQRRRARSAAHLHRHGRGLRAAVAGAAAAAVLIAGGAIWRGLAESAGGPQQPAAGCAQAGSCREVRLTDSRSHATAGRVIVTGRTAWLVPSGLPADDTTRQVYVLWQLNSANTMVAVGSFDVSGHQHTPLRIGSLAVPYGGTRAFAVSIEPGRSIPAHPSHPVALGQVPART
jgi:hypothetical protein